MEAVQIDIFSELYPKFVIDKPIRLIELFAGIGSQAAALRNIGADFTTYKVVEFDRYAIASYNAVHHTNFEPSDIRNIHASDLEIVERDKYCYILTYSFPCQDLSVAGNMKGMKKGEGTRSGLLWEVERILDECDGNLPQVLLMENVPMVIGQNSIEDFYDWRYKLESLGYQNYVDLLNAKDFGIPQNRLRCFMVSVLGEYSYEFPKPQDLMTTMKDFLEDHVDEKFYLTDRQMARFKAFDDNKVYDPDGLARTIQSTDYKRPLKVIERGYIENGTGVHQSNKVYDPDGLARALQSELEMRNPLKVVIDDE